jgi:hypothetical protein
MGSQKIEPANTEATRRAESGTQITRNRVVLSPVDPFYDLYLRYGSMKNALEQHKRQYEYTHDDENS